MKRGQNVRPLRLLIVNSFTRGECLGERGWENVAAALLLKSA